METETFFHIMFHPFLMMWAGQLLHLFKKLKELETEGQIISIKTFFRSHPYSVLFSMLAGFVVYGFLFTSNQLTAAGAFTAGYMADSMVSAFTNRELKRVEEEKPSEKHKED